MGSSRAWRGERLTAKRRKGLCRKIFIKVTPSRDINIRDQAERLISASIILGVGIQRHLSDTEDFWFKNLTLQPRTAPGCPSGDEPVSHCSLVLTCTEWLWPSMSQESKHTSWQVSWSSYEREFASLNVRERGWLTVCYSFSLCLMISVWEGRSSHRSALSQSRASGRPSVVLQIQGTGNHFEAIISKSFPSFFHIPQQQEGRALSSKKHLIPIDISGNKALKYLGESGSETLIAGMHLCETVTTKVRIYLARSFQTPTTKACSSRVTQHLSGLWAPCRSCEWNPHPITLHMVAHTTGF